MLLMSKRITLFVKGVAGKRMCASLAAVLAGLIWRGDAAAQEIKREEVGAQEQTSASIDYRNTETIDVSSLSLVTRGVAGSPGSYFSGKVGPGSGGSIVIENVGDIFLIGDQAQISAQSSGPDSIQGAHESNYSAQPGMAGAITLINAGKITRSSNDVSANRFAIELVTRQGNWSGSDETGGYTFKDEEDVPQYLLGHLGAAVSVIINEGDVRVDSGRGILARSVGGLGAGPAERDGIGRYDLKVSYEGGAGGKIDFKLIGASVATAGIAMQGESHGAEPSEALAYDLRSGGKGGAVSASLENVTRVTTNADGGHAFVLQSLGGDVSWYGGGIVGKVPDYVGSGGDGGEVTIHVDATSSIQTAGQNAHGIFAQSSGGGGAKGLTQNRPFYAKGQQGGAAGSGGSVRASNQGDIQTVGDQSFGILVGGVGGGQLNGNNTITSLSGGDGGSSISFGAFLSGAAGGDGGGGGNGPQLTIENTGTIITSGQYARGASAVTVGGNGGNGGATGTVTFSTGLATNGKSVNVNFAVGGSGGVGGDGGDVQFSGMKDPDGHWIRQGAIRTGDIGSSAVALYSVGGGGGAGGDAYAASVNVGSQQEVGSTNVVGGSSDGGGHGGEITVDNWSDLVTAGPSSNGIEATSVGGGGGNGGLGLSAYLDLAGAASTGGFIVRNSLAIGGKGGDGGSGGEITVVNGAGTTIETTAADSVGISVMSIGGGGGRGGDAVAAGAYIAASDGYSVTSNVALGATGGKGGAGGKVTVTNDGIILAGTSGVSDYSFGIMAQSVGGGGGAGGMASTVNLDLVKYVVDTFAPKWAKDFSKGDRGKSKWPTTLRLDVALGGNGELGGRGEEVSIFNNGTVQTFGANSAAIFAQSVGGGGGVGKTTYTKQVVDKNLTGQVGLGGKGGAAGAGGLVSVTNTGRLATAASGSPGIFAQSVGGGGGVGGSKDSSAVNPAKLFSYLDESLAWASLAKDFYDKGVSKPPETVKNVQAKPTQYTFAFQINHGGSGGAAGDGGDVSVINQGSIATSGEQAAGIFAQSVGGGGGDGGVGAVKGKGVTIGNESLGKVLKGESTLTDQFVKSAKDAFTNLGVNVAMGGDGGARGNGGVVDANVTSSVMTTGRHSTGIFLQSVGGGGGSGGAAIDKTVGLMRFGARLGGSGSNTGGDGGEVKLLLGSEDDAAFVSTQGENSPAIRLQSIGGGGGIAELMGTDIYENMAGIRPDADTAEQVLTDFIATLDIPEGGGDNKVVGDSDESSLAAATEAYSVITRVRDDYLKGQQDAMAVGLGELKSIFGGDNSGGGLAFMTIGAEQGVDGAAAGKGGDITTTLKNATVSTQGFASHGLSMWSIGGGGGLATPLTVDTFITARLKTSNGANGNGGRIDVSLGDALITTTGQMSHGIQAQSIGGGGGYMGTADLLIKDDTSNQAPPGGDGGDIKLTSTGPSTIRTSGSQSHGILMASAGSGFTTMHVDNQLVVTSMTRSGGRAGDIDLSYAGTIAASGEGSNAVLAVAAGTKSRSKIDLKFNVATISGGTGAQAAAIGIIGQHAKYTIAIGEGSAVTSTDGYAIATSVACASCQVGESSDWQTLTGDADHFNVVSVSDRSSITGDVRLTGPSLLKLEAGARWNPGERSLIGGGDIARAADWDQPVKFLETSGSALRTYSGVNLAGNVGTKAQGSVVLSGSTLNPGGPNRLMTSEIWTGGDAYGTHLLLTENATLEIDVGHDGSGARSDRVIVNPVGEGSCGTVMAGKSNEGGGYDLKIRLIGLKGITGQTYSVAQAQSVSLPDSLQLPLAVRGSYALSEAVGAEEAAFKRQSLNVQVDRIQFDTGSLSGFQSTVAQQMDEHLAAGNTELDGTMLQALGYYAGQEQAYAAQLEELAQTGNPLDVLGRKIQGTFLQNQLHSCQAFVGDGLGLIEQNCAYARVTGTAVNLSGTEGASSQTFNGSQITLGGQHQIGDGLFAGFMLGVGQSTGDSSDNEYQSNTESVTLGAVIKKRFEQKYEVAFSGTYSYGWMDSSRYLASDLAAPALLTGSNRNQEAGLRLRLAYYGTTDDFYVKPYVDFDARHFQSGAFTETGNSPFKLSYPSMSFWTYTATPSLEIGTRINTDSGVWRAYVSGGAALSNDNKQTMLMDFESTSGGAPIELEWEATPTMGIVNIGAEYIGKDNTFFTLGYQGMFGDGVTQHAITARVGMRF